MFKLQDGGVGQRGSALEQSAWGTDGSRMKFSTYVDRDSSIVGTDTYQIWAYPENTTGTILAYSALVQYNYNRANDHMGVAFPRTFDSFVVGGQDWMNGWTSFTSTISGSGGGSASSPSSNCAYKLIGKTCFVRMAVEASSKNTLSGRIYFSLPFTGVNHYEASAHAMLGAVGTKDSNHNYFPVIAGSNLEFLAGIEQAGDWSTVPAGLFIMKGIFAYEIV